MNDYAEFLASKAPRAQSTGFEPRPMPAHLFDFQAACVDFCIRQGRAGLYLDTGLGKTRCQLEWLRQCGEESGGGTLLLTPLAVARQIEREALSLGYDARVIRDQGEARGGINICNYDRLQKLDADAFSAVSLDESSIIKSFTGKTTRALIGRFAGHRFRLSATATPAPNDHMELGQQADFLGIMASNEMLARWFISDQTEMGRYRLKGHATVDFWDWMASWSRMAQSPDDLGLDGSRFALPPLEIVKHASIGAAVRPEEGSLFAGDVSATGIHGVKRQTTDARADKAAEIAPECCIVWCDTDYEADALKKRLPDAIEVRGSMPIDRKEEALDAFSTGKVKRIITKPEIGGLGLNWQHCATQIFVGRTFSYERWYQAVRRSWRFGQKSPVKVHLIVAEGEAQIGRVIDRKAGDHAAMKTAMAAAMRRNIRAESKLKVAYEPKHEGRLPTWLSDA